MDSFSDLKMDLELPSKVKKWTGNDSRNGENVDGEDVDWELTQRDIYIYICTYIYIYKYMLRELGSYILRDTPEPDN